MQGICSSSQHHPTSSFTHLFFTLKMLLTIFNDLTFFSRNGKLNQNFQGDGNDKQFASIDLSNKDLKQNDTKKSKYP